MMNFNKLNDEANYYSELSGKTGVNSWNQDKFQTGMIEMVEHLNLSKEQLLGLLDSMVKNNQELDMDKSYNESKVKYEMIVKNKIEALELEQKKGMSRVA